MSTMSVTIASFAIITIIITIIIIIIEVGIDHDHAKSLPMNVTEGALGFNANAVDGQAVWTTTWQELPRATVAEAAGFASLLARVPSAASPCEASATPGTSDPAQDLTAYDAMMQKAKAPAASVQCLTTEGPSRALKVKVKIQEHGGRKPSKNVEAELYKLLQKLSPEVRRALLIKDFTEAQRLSLERWILQHRATLDKGLSVSRKPYRKKVTANATCCTQLPRKSTGVPLSTRAGNKTMGKPQVLHPRSIAGVHGVQSHRQQGRLFFCASVSVGPFSLHSRKTSNFSQVLSFRRVLLSIQHCVLSSGGSNADAADSLCSSLAKEIEAHTLENLLDVGLRLVAYVPARHWVGKMLATPRFAVADLNKGLLAWRRLHEARNLIHVGHTPLRRCHSADKLAQVWQKLRATYVSIWVEAGHRRETVIAKIQALEDHVRIKKDLVAVKFSKTQLVNEARAAAPPPKASETS